jgi:triosephosphate isomerase
MRKPLLAGNWKMYKTLSDARALAQGLKSKLQGLTDRDVLVCPPFTALSSVAQELKGSSLQWGGQNAHWEKEGAFTGDIAAVMLKDIGCTYAIVGHSERRQIFGETDAMVNKRMQGVLAVGLTPIVCIGETLAEREAGKTFSILERQIKESMAGLKPESVIVIAYEPVWAIGTGKTATPDQAQEAHVYVRKQFGALYGPKAAEAVRILYGGSVKPDNAKALMGQGDIDGALVGGASLDVESFTKIVRFDA